VTEQRVTRDEVRALREGAGLTTTQVSELLGVPLRTWQRWEKGDNAPHAATIRLLCKLTRQPLPPSLPPRAKPRRKRSGD
jgi:DNA-binding transcriptional regulator YiaG